MFKEVNNKLFSASKFLGEFSIIASIAMIAYSIGYPIYNGDIIIISDIAVQCLIYLASGATGVILSWLLACISEINTSVKAIKQAYDQSTEKLQKLEAKSMKPARENSQPKMKQSQVQPQNNQQLNQTYQSRNTFQQGNMGYYQQQQNPYPVNRNMQNVQYQGSQQFQNQQFNGDLEFNQVPPYMPAPEMEFPQQQNMDSQIPLQKPSIRQKMKSAIFEEIDE